VQAGLARVIIRAAQLTGRPPQAAFREAIRVSRAG